MQQSGFSQVFRLRAGDFVCLLHMDAAFISNFNIKKTWRRPVICAFLPKLMLYSYLCPMKVHGMRQALSTTLQKRHKVWAGTTPTSFWCYIYAFPDPWREFSWDSDLITSDSEPRIQTLRHLLFLVEGWGSHWKHCFEKAYFSLTQELQGNP